MGLSIGSNKLLTCRKFAFQGFVLAVVYSLVGGCVVPGIHNQLAHMFTEVAEVLPELKYQMVLAGCLCFVAGSGPTGSTIFRVIDKAGFYSIIMICNQVFLSTTLSALFLFYFKLGAPGIGY